MDDTKNHQNYVGKKFPTWVVKHFFEIVGNEESCKWVESERLCICRIILLYVWVIDEVLNH